MSSEHREFSVVDSKDGSEVEVPTSELRDRMVEALHTTADKLAALGTTEGGNILLPSDNGELLELVGLMTSDVPLTVRHWGMVFAAYANHEAAGGKLYYGGDSRLN